MTTPATSGDLVQNIQALVPDNNAGLISASDIRDNMVATVLSISPIVASGDTDGTYPFTNNVRAQVQDAQGSPYGGIFIAESGVSFPNAPVNDDKLQREPFLGVTGIDHNQLMNLDNGDPHKSQYVSLSGVKNGRYMTGNLAVGPNFVSASGSDNEGISFTPNPSGNGQDVNVHSSVSFPDSSQLHDANGAARAWLYFDMNDGNGFPSIKSSYNVYSVERTSQGKVTVTFPSGLFADNSYVAVGNSNARTDDDEAEDFDRNTVGLVSRTYDGSTGRRSITYLVLNEQGNYVDAQQNNLSVFGYSPNTNQQNTPIVVGS